VKPLIPYFDQPVLHLGPIPLYGFGVMVALGFFLGGKVAMARAARLGLDPEAINRLIGWLVVGTFVGGHLGYLLMYAPQDLTDPARLFNVFDGLSSFGGFFACVPIAFWFFWKNRLPVWPYLDSVAIGLGLGWGLGRMGCFLAHDHPGPPTDFYLGVYGICPNEGRSVACHDLGLYEALWAFAVFALFLALDRKPRVPGFYPLLLGVLYAPVRFGLDSFRPESTDLRWWGGLTGAQFGSALFLILAAYGLWRRAQSGDAPAWTDRAAQLAALDAAVQAAPTEVEPLLARAEQLLAWGNRSHAERDLEAALRLRPGDPQIQARLAHVRI
jgi:phosphatidylglycerol:prolipoprotein diacylglycerol transferase